MASYQPLLRSMATWITFLAATTVLVADETDRIQIHTQNPRYWQYKGQPVLLLGGSKTDHIFLAEGLKEHLDEIATVGANFVRNTMSQREGVDLKPHKRLPGGKFDLDQWNDDYWKRFANCLQWCHERDIIIQIEVWDRSDFSREHWEISPWRPQNNVNYSGRRPVLPRPTLPTRGVTGNLSSTPFPAWNAITVRNRTSSANTRNSSSRECWPRVSSIQTCCTA